MIASYRLQLTPDFGFSDARRLVPYLHRLGISHLYLSPLTEARSGSTHGYDVIDHNAVRAELGGALQLQRLLAAARQHKMRVIIDIVPNHAGLGPQNARWQDVLTYGPHSPFARYFDIDWEPAKLELRGKLLLPFLGQSYGEVLAKGDMGFELQSGRLYATYFAHRFAIAPRAYASILMWVASAPNIDAPTQRVLRSLAQSFASWQAPDRTLAEQWVTQLQGALDDDAFTAAWRQVSEAITPAQMHQVLEEQFWRLANWRTAGHEINYRRFFEINDLIGLRMEDPHVFAATHRLVKELLCDDVVEGLRIDHIDGLSDPLAYLQRLQTLGARHIWVEKILASDECLPANWPVNGTTGYEFGADVLALFTHPLGKKPLTSLYRRFAPGGVNFAEEAWQSKRLIMTNQLGGELQRLANELDRLSEHDLSARDFTLQALRDALTDIIASFPRYRTYLPHAPQEAKQVIVRAAEDAAARNVEVDGSIYTFIMNVLLGHGAGKAARLAWIARFQQYTAPVTAKGIEDTAFYRYHRCAALNEVGASPVAFGTDVADFHDKVTQRAKNFPRSMLATSTHDSKRGEDLRMRLVVLSELPQAWEATVRDLHRCAKKHLHTDGPSRNDIYLLYQMMIALWEGHGPNLKQRLLAYMQKVAREAKRHTSWTNINERYEGRLRAFVAAMLDDPEVAIVIAPLAKQLAVYGLQNSLSQVVLKLTGPGMPDIYRGCELIDLTLVDPDNRRQVDFAHRQRLLEDLRPLVENPAPDDVLNLLNDDADTAKLYVVARLLRLRQRIEGLRSRSYRGLAVTGDRAAHTVAYQRGTLVVVVPRQLAVLSRKGTWKGTQVELPQDLSHRKCQELLSGAIIHTAQTLDLGDLPLPWAVLQGKSSMLPAQP